MNELAAYASLFAAAFLAATPLPGSSEVVLVGLMTAGTGETWTLVAVASLGNTLGSVLNWACGRFLIRYRDARWFPVSGRQIDRATALFNRYGLWALLFAWSPIGGDALTVIAGLLRVGIVPFLILVGIGKTLRYVVVALTALGLFGA